MLPWLESHWAHFALVIVFDYLWQAGQFGTTQRFDS